MDVGSDVRAALSDVRDRPSGRVYVLEVAVGCTAYMTERRYSELSRLNVLIRRLRPALFERLPPFPRKSKWRVRLGLKSDDADFLEERRARLASWVLAVVDQVPDIAVKELLWRGANWCEVPRAIDLGSRCWSRKYLAEKPELSQSDHRLSERTTQAGSFSSTSLTFSGE
jgi:hypothetical protein